MTAPPARFVARVVAGPDQGAQVTVDGRTLVGRASSNDLVLADDHASRSHLDLTVDGRTVIVSDLGSRRGTSIDGRRIERPTPVRDGAAIRVGRSLLRVLRVDGAPASAGPELRLVGPGIDTALPNGRAVVVGRDPAACDVVVTHPSASRTHCRITRTSPDGATVEDLGSTGGTFVNGRAVADPVAVGDGDAVGLGAPGVELRLHRVAAHPASPTTVDIEVRAEGTGAPAFVRVVAPGDATVGAVVDRLAAYLGLPAEPWSGSAGNGCWLAYRPDRSLLLARSAAWRTAPVRRGDLLVLGPAPSSPDAVAGPVVDEPGHLAVNQLPRTLLGPPELRPVLPEIAEGTALRGRGVAWQLVAALASVTGGLAVGLISGRWIFGAIFALVGLLAVGAGILGEQSRRRFRAKEFRRRVEVLDAELATGLAAQRTTADQLAPAASVLASWVDGPDPRVWERRPGDPDFLAVRLGRARVPARVVADDGWRRSTSPLAPELGVVLERHRELDDAPLQVPHAAAPVIGVVGEGEVAAGTVRSIVAQAAVLHSPHDLGIAVLAVDDRWGWLRWLPHVVAAGEPELASDASGAADLARRLLDAATGDEPTPPRLCLVPAPALALADVRALLAAAGPAGWQVVVAASDQRSLPPEASILVVCPPTGPAELHSAAMARTVTPFAPEPLAVDEAERLADRLRLFHDPRSAPPAVSVTTSLGALLGFDRPATADIGRLWAQGPPQVLSAVVGWRDDDRPLEVSFRHHGPHGLLAGTTGSGKSVFLQTLLASLVTTHGPDLLSLFLVDYKGGAAFAPFARIPHVAGLVTDLAEDPSLLGRALTALDAELVRRKELLRDAGNAESLSEYERLPGVERIRNLLVVIDEYAALASDPANEEDVKRLEQVAIQGRSLGVHLLLAMQSPQGVVKPVIRKNTNIWVCLRVVESGESVEVVGRPDAAAIAIDAPGRGFVRLGGGSDVTGFQSAMVEDASTSGDVVVRPFADVRPATVVVAVDATARDRPLRDLCDRIEEHARRTGTAPARQLWLPPLPLELDPGRLADLPADDRLTVRLGLADEPERALQETAGVDLAEAGSLVLLGEFGSGKTSTLVHLVLDLAARFPPDAVHVYVLDAGSGAFAPFERLPHVAAVVSADDRERCSRLLARLTTVVRDRREGSAGGTWRDRRRLQLHPDPRLVLVVDDFQLLRQAANESGDAGTVEQIANLVSSGPPVGVHVVLAAAQQADVRSTLLNRFGLVAALRLADVSDYEVVGLRGARAKVWDPPPGRALVSGRTTRCVQIPWRTDEVPVGPVGPPPIDPDGLPRPVRAMPAAIGLDEVRAAAPGPLAGAATVLGVGGPELAPVVIDHDRFGPVLLVLGDDLSGRSTTLLTCFEEALRGRPDAAVGIVAPRTSPLRSIAQHPAVSAYAGSAEEALELLDDAREARDLTHLIVDDAELLPGAAGDVLEQLLRRAREDGSRITVSARTSDFTRTFDSWARYLTSLKSGLLLMPGPGAGSALDVRLPVGGPAMVPGRGYLVARGAATVVQVATPRTGF